MVPVFLLTAQVRTNNLLSVSWVLSLPSTDKMIICFGSFPSIPFFPSKSTVWADTMILFIPNSSIFTCSIFFKIAFVWKVYLVCLYGFGVNEKQIAIFNAIHFTPIFNGCDYIICPFNFCQFIEVRVIVFVLSSKKSRSTMSIQEL